MNVCSFSFSFFPKLSYLLITWTLMSHSLSFSIFMFVMSWTQASAFCDEELKDRSLNRAWEAQTMSRASRIPWARARLVRTILSSTSFLAGVEKKISIELGLCKTGQYVIRTRTRDLPVKISIMCNSTLSLSYMKYFLIHY